MTLSVSGDYERAARGDARKTGLSVAWLHFVHVIPPFSGPIPVENPPQDSLNERAPAFHPYRGLLL
jgi:hypothetical protein